MREIISRRKGRRKKRSKVGWRQCDNMSGRRRMNEMRECYGWEGRREGEQRDYSFGITVFFIISC